MRWPRKREPDPNPVRPELVEGLSFFSGRENEEKQGFDRLSLNG
jgi:hypothetical protein